MANSISTANTQPRGQGESSDGASRQNSRADSGYDLDGVLSTAGTKTLEMINSLASAWDNATKKLGASAHGLIQEVDNFLDNPPELPFSLDDIIDAAEEFEDGVKNAWGYLKKLYSQIKDAFKTKSEVQESLEEPSSPQTEIVIYKMVQVIIEQTEPKPSSRKNSFENNLVAANDDVAPDPPPEKKPSILSKARGHVDNIVKFETNIQEVVKDIFAAGDKLVSYVEKNFDFGKGLGESFNKVKEGFKVFDDVVLSVIPTLKAVGTSLRGLFMLIAANPIGALITAIAAITVGIFMMRDEINMGIDSTTTLGDVFRAIGYFIGEAFTEITDVISNAFGSISGIFDSLNEALGGSLDWITDLIGSSSEGFDSFSLSFAGVVEFLARCVDTIVGYYMGLRSSIIVIFENIPNIIISTWVSVINQLSPYVESFINDLIGKINVLLSAVGKQTIDPISLKINLPDLSTTLNNVSDEIEAAMNKGKSFSLFQNSVNSLFDKAAEIGKQRVANEGKNTPSTPPSSSSGRGSGHANEGPSFFTQMTEDLASQSTEIDKLLEKYSQLGETITEELLPAEVLLNNLRKELEKPINERQGKLNNGEIGKLIEQVTGLLAKQKELQAHSLNEKLDAYAASLTKNMQEQNAAYEEALKLQGLSQEEKDAHLVKLNGEIALKELLLQLEKDHLKVSDEQIEKLKERTAAYVASTNMTNAKKNALGWIDELEKRNEEFALNAIFSEDEKNRIILEKETETWKKRISALEAGSEEQKRLQEQVDIWYQNRLLEPQIQRTKELFNSIESSFHDGFVKAMTSGDARGALKDLGKTLKSTIYSHMVEGIYQATLKPYVVNLVGNLVGGLGGVFGGGTGGGAGGGGTGDIGSILQGGSSLLSLGGIGSGITSIGTTLGLTGLSEFGAAFTIGGNLGLKTALGWAFDGTITGTASTGMVLGAAAPYIAGAVLAYSILKDKFKGETRIGGQYSMKDDEVIFNHGPSGGPGDKKASESLLKNAYQSINSMFIAVGSQAALADFYGGWETSEKKRGGVISGGVLNTGEIFGKERTGSNYDQTYYESEYGFSGNADEMFKRYQTTLKAVQIQALQAAEDIPNALKKLVDGVQAKSLSDEEVTELLNTISTQINGVTALTALLETMPFPNLKDQLYDTKAALISFSGGIDTLSQRLGVYYQKYYSDTERTGHLYTQLSQTFTELGHQIPKSRDEFRRLVESIDVSTEYGAKLYAQLIGLAGSFDELMGAASQAVEQARSDVQAAYEAEANVLRNAINANEAFIKSIDSLVESLKFGNVSPLSPEQKYVEYRSALDELIAKAENGDEEAKAKIPEMIGRFLEMSQSYYASSEKYQADYTKYLNEAERLRALTGSQLDIQRSQLAKLDAMVAGILNVDTSVKSLESALANYNKVVNSVTPPTTPVRSTPFSQSSIEGFYWDVLGRGADKEGLAFWLAYSQDHPTLSIDEFKNIIKSAAISNGELKAVNGSHAMGLSYVPFDGYIAELHQGESVLTATESIALSNFTLNNSSAVLEELKGLRSDNQALRDELSRLETALVLIEENQQAQINQQSAIAEKDTSERDELVQASRSRMVTVL